MSHDCAHRRGELPVRSTDGAEHTRCIAPWSARPSDGKQALHQRPPAAGVGQSGCYAADSDLAAAPIDITELEISDLRAAHPNTTAWSGWRSHAGPRSCPDCTCPATAALRRRQARGTTTPAATQPSRHRLRQRNGHMACHVQKPQQRADCGHRRFGRLRVAVPAVAEDERHDLPRIQPLQRSSQRLGKVSKEFMGLLTMLKRSIDPTRSRVDRGV